MHLRPLLSIPLANRAFSSPPFQRAAMSTQRALVHKSKGVFEVRDDVPLPRLRDDYILVKTKAVALNPTDWKNVNNAPTPGAIAGCDYSGIVERIGKNVTIPFKIGDKVAGFVRGGKPSPFIPLST